MTDRSGERSLLYLKFKTGGQLFMIPAYDVVAVRRWAGDVNEESLENSLSLPAIDLNRLFLLETETPRNEGTILVISNSSGISALVVDKMYPAVEIPSEEIHPLPSAFANLECPFSNVTVNEPGSELILILDCQRLLALISSVSPEFVLEPNYAA